MGVPGLTSFVDENPYLLTDLHLHNTKVVIDGNNLYHFLYKLYDVIYTYGGDYDVYAKSITNYFLTLKSVGIEPYVVFDGTYDIDDRKLKTVLKRTRHKLSDSHAMSKGGYGCVIPLMASIVFREVLTNLGIWFVACDGEADGEIASLAIKLGCPVMSNDSDFYIYDLQHGFILFDYLNLKVKTDKDNDGNDYHYLHAQVYYLDNLLKKYPKLDRQIIPLFATVMGNDFVDREHFTLFFKAANVTGGKRQISPKRHYKMAQVLHWMNKCKGDILTRVMDTIPKDKEAKVRELINLSMQTYTSVTENASLENNILDRKDTDRTSYGGSSFPDWFVAASRDMKIFTHFMNAVVIRKVFVPCQVELRELPSSMNCCTPLRQVIYSILLTVETDSSPHKVVEYIREEGQIVKKDVTALTETSLGVPIPNLKDLPIIDVNEREAFFYHCLGIDPQSLQGLPQHFKLFVVVLIYSIRNATPKLMKTFIYSVMVCFIKLSIADKDSEDGDPKHLPKDFATVRERLDMYATPMKHNNASKFNGRIIHHLSQFQVCWWTILQLSQLLTLPDQLPSVASSINGSFIYHLCYNLNSRRNMLEFIQDLLGGKTTAVMANFDLINQYVFQNISDEDFEEAETRISKKSRRKSKAKTEKAAKMEIEKDSDSNDHHDEEESDKSQNWEVNCDLSNKYANLMDL